MQIKDRQKICSHCDGRIAVEADTCLYCGMPLLAEKQAEPKMPPQDILSSLQGGIPSLYPPLYSQKGEALHKKNTQESATDNRSRATMSTHEVVSSLPETDPMQEKSGILSIVLTLVGSNLFILGLMQGFFSEQGLLRLEWNCSYWFAYLLASAPLVYFGIKKTNKAS